MPGVDVPCILLTGVVPAGPSGVRDYGDLLARELQRSGVSAHVRWATNDARSRSATAAARHLFAIARHTDRRTTVVWNYAPGTSGHRGLPGASVLLGVLLRFRGVPVIVVLHELAEPWRRQPVSTKIRSLAAVLALVPVLLGSGTWVVTTVHRARRLAPLGRLLRRDISFVPVFSNLGERPVRSDADATRFLIGVLDHGAVFARPDVVVRALAELRTSGPARLVLIGAPGPGSPKAAIWHDLASTVGVDDAVEHSGVLPLDELAGRLGQTDVVVLPNAQGPASRKGTLAAALAHGRPTVSLDGPMRWDRLVDAGAVVVVPPEAGALASALRLLREEPSERARLGAAGARFYQAEMSVGGAATAVRGLAEQAQLDSVSSPRSVRQRVMRLHRWSPR